MMITHKVTISNNANVKSPSLFERLKSGFMNGSRKVVHIPGDGLKSGSKGDIEGFGILFGGMTLLSLIVIFGLATLVGALVKK